MPPTKNPPGSTGNGLDDGAISGASPEVVLYEYEPSPYELLSARAMPTKRGDMALAVYPSVQLAF